jgi:hypothetical protein
MVYTLTGARGRRLADYLPYFLPVAFANGIFSRFEFITRQFGVAEGLLTTYGVSIIAWIAMYYSVMLLQKSEVVFRSADAIVLGLALALACFPVSGLAWVGLTILSAYYLYGRDLDDYAHRGFVVLLSLCFSLFWAREFSRVFMDYILRFDTLMVATVTGTESTGNLIRAADGSTTLIVGEQCSSFTNLSLSVLGWMVARCHYGTRGRMRSLVFIFLLALVVVTINTIRIGVIALDPALYELAHGNVGSTIANLTTSIAVGYIAILGARK